MADVYLNSKLVGTVDNAEDFTNKIRDQRRKGVVSDNLNINYEKKSDRVEIECSKGTYIRVIANDFGEKLGCGAYLSSLRRTKIGEYSVEDSLTISELNNIKVSDLKIV